MSTVITGDKIGAFVMLQVYYKLHLEVMSGPNGMRWRGVTPMQQAKRIMAEAGIDCPHRTKAAVLKQYETVLIEAGILRPQTGERR